MKLYNNDCLKVLPTISDKSINFILTDPPYGTTQCKWDSIIPFKPMWKELKRVIKDNGCIALFGTEPFSSHLRLSNLSYFKYDWIWEKSHATGFLNSWKQPLRKFELIHIFYNKKCFYNPQITDKTLKNIRPENNKTKQSESYSYHKLGKGFRKLPTNKAMPTNIIKFNSQQKSVHPTQKPIDLLEYLIKTYTNKNDTILDFTMGSGSTGVACKNLNRNFIGIELDKNYFEIAKNRIESTLC